MNPKLVRRIEFAEPISVGPNEAVRVELTEPNRAMITVTDVVTGIGYSKYVEAKVSDLGEITCD